MWAQFHRSSPTPPIYQINVRSEPPQSIRHCGGFAWYSFLILIITQLQITFYKYNYVLPKNHPLYSTFFNSSGEDDRTRVSVVRTVRVIKGKNIVSINQDQEEWPDSLLLLLCVACNRNI